MNIILNKIAGTIKKSFRLLFFVAFLSTLNNAQTTTNLDKFYSIIDSTCARLINNLGNFKQVKLEMELGTFYSVFANKIRGDLLKSGITFIPEIANNENETSVNFIIDECTVNYGQPEKDGLFGDFYTERTIKVSGSYFISANQNVDKFVITEKDPVNVSDIEKIENRSYPFTQGDLPSEPFFSSLLEPFIAVGAAAITVILFFSIRSK